MSHYKTYQSMVDNEPSDENTYEVQTINNLQERQGVIAANRLVVVDNYTNWCGPCKTCAPGFANLAQKYNREGLCKLVKEDVDNKQPTPEPINGVPCFHFYIHGNFISDATVTGVDLQKVEQTVNDILSSFK